MGHDGTVKGYAAYKVADNVKNHYAVGLGSYDVFIYTNGASIFMDNAYEVPNTENVIIENCCITEISMADGPAVGNHGIINGFGPGISTGSGGNGYAVQAVTYYCNGKGVALPDFYERKGDKADITEADTTTEEDIKAPSADPKEEENTSVISISSISFKDRDDAYPVVIETAQITISVVDVAVTGLEILNRSEIENGLKTGESIMMDVQVNPSDATDQDLVFRTSNKKIASVNKDGIVTGHKAGSTIITAQAGDQTAEVTVHVVNTELESIDVANQQSEMFVGENWKMQMKVVPEKAPLSSMEFSCSPSTVASVDGKGKVTALSEGNALITIRATVEGTGVSTDIRVQMFKSIPAAQNVKVTKTNRSDHNVVITWDPVNDAEKYIVRRYKGNSAIPVELGTVTATSYTDSAIEPGEYSWQIVAVPSDKNYTDNSVSNRTNSVIIPKDAQGLSCEPVQMPCKCCSGKGRFSRDMEYI